MGYSTRCDAYGVFVWELFNVLGPLLGGTPLTPEGEAFRQRAMADDDREGES